MNKTATQVLQEQDRDYIREAVEHAAKEMAEDIDFGVIADMLKESGWIEIKFPVHHTTSRAYEMHQWLEMNCKGCRHSRGTRFLFEEQADAVNFSLRWK